MSFLAPLFLLGLTALAVPIVIHLIQRERRTIVPFPSLMFLRRIPYKSVRRRRIRHWALLALRLAALAFIIAAFARPFVPGAGAAGVASGARDVVIVLDRSFSMSYADTWNRAQAAARQVIDELRPDDRGSLVLFGGDVQVVTRSTNDRSSLAAAVQAAEPGPGATRYGAALKLAGSLLAGSTMPRREVVLVSDFQRAGWEPDQTLRLPSGVTLIPVSVRADDVANLAATPATVQREMFSGRERAIITAGVLNRGTEATEAEVTLEIDGRAVQSARVSVSGNGSASTTFQPVTLTAPNTRATIRLPDDRLARDNLFHFVLAPSEPLPVVLLTRSGARRDETLYLTRALSIGDRPRFDVSAVTGDDVPADALARARVVIVDDLPVSAGAAGRLTRFVEAGGGLVVALGPRSSWPERETGSLPGKPGAAMDRTRGTPATLTGLEFGHPVFEPFRAPRSGDFSSARFYGYRALAVTPDAAILARFDDGTPALAERRLGLGRVLAWTSTLDLDWSDLPLKPVFLPFVHQVIRHAAAYREQPASLTVGQVLDLSGRTADRDRVALSPDGQRVPIPSGQAGLLELTEQGFYEIRDGDGKTLVNARVVASNVELAESDLTPVDPQEIVASVAGSGPGGAQSAGGEVLTAETQERAQRIWWYLLFAGILLLTVETWVAHRLSRAT
jgi:hypothetical protein